jgi:hypothetical protein
MSVCHAASIGIHEEAIEYTGLGGAHWRIPISRVRVLGEYRSADDDRGILLAILFDDSGTWLQAPRNAIGADQLLQTLFQHWGTASPVERDSTLTGRVLWPAELAGEPLFEPRFGPRASAAQISNAVSKWLAHHARP